MRSPRTPAPQSALLILIVSFAVLTVGWSVQEGRALEPSVLNGNHWQIAPENEVKESGEQISKVDFAPTSWVAAQVPSTVFGSYVLAGLEPEPTYGDNIEKVDYAKYNRNFWYRTEFTVPSAYGKGRIWLNFDGVNRDADVFLNGQKLGSIQGFFQRGRFDVTALVQHEGKNVLAVLDHFPPLKEPPPPPAPPKYQFLLIAKYCDLNSPSFICSRGWDWMPAVPGLNMGIYKDVYLSQTGDVSVLDPWVRTIDLQPAEADLAVQVDLANHSAAEVKGELVGEINPGKIAFRKAVVLPPNTTQTCRLGAEEFSALKIQNPKLWWPNGYGDPSLYTCHLEFRVGPGISDQKNVSFGIRKYTYDTDGDIMHFHINGVRIFPKGGSWGMAEFMLRCHGGDYDTKVRFHKEENFNIIRNWMGMTADQAFYDACDKYGIMVWDEFWLNADSGTPSDPGVFQANVVEKIKQVRNHPSIVFWAGENEGSPPRNINTGIVEALKTYDGNDHRYSPDSHSGSLSGSGPYTNLDPKQYFVSVFSNARSKQPYGMRSELGTPTFVNYDSFKRFMPTANQWPENEMWNQHFFGRWSDDKRAAAYTASVNHSYGAARNIQDFCLKAQLLNIETMKAMFEGFLDHSDHDASGLIIWMSQSAFPSMVWQTYDYYYDLTGSFWGAKSACEPVHIYWNRATDEIRVVNTSGRQVDGLTAEGVIYNLDGSRKAEQKARIDSSPTAVADCLKLEFPTELSPTHFIRLRLLDRSAKVVSDNFYWRGVKELDYAALADLKPVRLVMTSRFVASANSTMLSADISNPANSGTVAVAIRPKLVDAGSGTQILPVHMSDGYFSLLPGETRRVTLEYDPASVGGKAPRLDLECWNNSINALK